jgi:ABC-type bacteriocin/lantibiotic exporter with double-glycine peptidase domain
LTNNRILEICLAFADELKIKLDPIRLQELFHSLHIPTNCAPQVVFHHLNDLGTASNIKFLEHFLEESELREVLSQGIVPMMTFVEIGLETVPFIVKGYSKGMVYGTIFRESGTLDERFSIKDFLRLARNGCPNLKLQSDKPMYIITPLAIEPLVSEFSDQSHSGHHLTPFRRLVNLLFSDRKEIWYIYVYAVVIGLLSINTPLAVQAIIGLISGGLILEPVVVLISFVILATLVSGVLQILQVRIVETIKQRIFAKAAFEFAFRIPQMKLEALRDYYPPELVNRFFDVITIQKGYSKLLTDLLGAVLQIVFGLILLSFYHPFFVFFGIGLLSMLVMIFVLTGPRGLQTSIMESKYKYKVVFWLEEVARTLSTFKLAGFTNLPLERTDHEVMNYLKKRQSHFQILIIQYIAIVVFKVIITAGILILGSILVIDGQISLGQFVAADIVIITTLSAVEKLILSMDTIYDLLTAADKVGHVTDIELDRAGGISLPNSEKGVSLEVKQLTYCYPNGSRAVLQDVQLSIQSGERVGIVGIAGSGKTTFLNVITGLLESYQGQVSYDGYSLRDLNIASLRDQVGDNLSSQDIFDGTIEENIALGKPGITPESIMWALRVVGLSDFIHNLPQGLRTPLVAGGTQLPLTVIKKIILARTLAEKPRLMVFDDFFLNMGNTFIEQLDSFLYDKSVNPSTMITITSNPAILSRCDKVVVFEAGQVVQAGTYKSLLEAGALNEVLPFFPQINPN